MRSNSIERFVFQRAIPTVSVYFCGGFCYNIKNIDFDKEQRTMKIAVTYENGEVFQHFGHTETFKIYEVEDGKVVSSRIIESGGSGHGALAGLLAEQGTRAEVIAN